MLHKLIRDIKFDTSGGAKMNQRLLLMLDEFPQLGNLKSMELALAVCAGYGIKVCIVAQDVNQLNKEYTKDNSIASNCHIHVYFTPNLDSGAATAESISKNLGKKTIKTVSHSDGGGLGKGSNSESFTGRELMMPDEVSHMSSEKELVFVAGHRPIFGDKLRYYLQPFFTERLEMYQKIYMREHGCEEACRKYNHDCERCVKEFKTATGKVPIACPKYPLYSDSVTRVLSFKDLFAVNAAEKTEREEKAKAVRLEKEYAAREEAKANEKPKAAEERESALVVETAGENVSAETGGAAEETGKPRNGDLAREVGAGEEMRVVEVEWRRAEGGAAFGESLAAKRKYEESWERHINGESGELQNNGNDASELHE